MIKVDVVARKMLDKLGDLKVPISVENLVKDYKIQIKYEDFEGEEMSGALKRKGKEGKPVIVVNKKHSIERQRFTIAHELGHFILHARGNLFIDRGSFVFYRDKTSSDGIKKQEIEANQFAAELLMPTILLKRDCFKNLKLIVGDDITRLVEKLAKKYKVSEQAMSIRISKFIY